MAKLVEFAWLSQEFNRIHIANGTILKRLDDLHEEHLLILKQIGGVRFDYKVGPVVNKKQTKENETC